MLVREDLLKDITKLLATWQTENKLRGEINLYDGYLIAEYYVGILLNEIYGYELKNLNDDTRNNVGIDLGDSANALAVQVTATRKRVKIQETIDKFLKYGLHESYDALYIFVLTEKQGSYKEFDTSGKFSFDPDKHIIDVSDLIQEINRLDTAHLRRLSDRLTVETSTAEYASGYQIQISLQYYSETGLGSAYLVRIANKGTRPITYTDVALQLDSGLLISYNELARHYIQLSTPSVATLQESEFNEFLFPLYHVNRVYPELVNPLQVSSVNIETSLSETISYPGDSTNQQQQFSELMDSVQTEWSANPWLKK